jgi:hypothetical protein
MATIVQEAPAALLAVGPPLLAVLADGAYCPGTSSFINPRTLSR